MNLTLQDLQLGDVLALQGLKRLGPQTRSQLMNKGLDLFLINKLEKLGVLVQEHDNATNLNYYKVNDGLFEGT
jgi:hypothetical protein